MMLRYSPTPAQARCIDHILGRPATLCAGKPGTGKTGVGLAVIYDTLPVLTSETGGRVLIVAPPLPASTAWLEDNEKFGFGLDMRFLHGRQKHLGDEQVSIVTYSGLLWLAAELKGNFSGYGLVIYDESHHLKTPSSVRFSKWRHYAPKIPMRLALTGTPQPKNVADLWAQIFLLDQGASLGKRVGEFRDQYMKMGRWGWLARPEALQTLLDGPLKDLIVSMDHAPGSLPPITHNKIYFDLPTPALKLYREIQHKLASEDGQFTASNYAVAAQRCKRIASGSVPDGDGIIKNIHRCKLDIIKNLVAELQGEPLLLFYEFMSDRDQLISVLDKKTTLHISGDTSVAQRVENLNKFNTGNYPVLLGQVRAAGTGGNFQARCSTVCFYSVPWSAADLEQSIHRVYRMGQNEPCYVHYLISRGTRDEVSMERVRDKISNQNIIFNQKAV